MTSLQDLVSTRFPGLSSRQVDKACLFYDLLYAGNQKQNLTRIEGPSDFVEGHLLDVVELVSLNWMGLKVADIGSGSGVPGLLAAAIDLDLDRKWHLIESEHSKAAYLDESSQVLGLNNRLKVHPERAEKAVFECSPDTVIARAVGTVDKIAAWIWNCSTWNNLILFKSRGWANEWESAKTTKYGKKLTVSQMHEYSSQGKYRNIVLVTRK